MRGLTGLRALHIRFYFSKIRFTYVAHVRSGGYRPVKADRLFKKQRIDDTTLLPGMADGMAPQGNENPSLVSD